MKTNYALCLCPFAAANPTDASVQHIWSGLNTSASQCRVQIPISWYIRSAQAIFNVAWTLGTSEDVLLSIMVNGVTNATYAIWKCTLDSTTAVASNYGLAIPVTTNDYVSIRITYPTWATNPTSVSAWWQIWIEG